LAGGAYSVSRLNHGPRTCVRGLVGPWSCVRRRAFDVVVHWGQSDPQGQMYRCYSSGVGRDGAVFSASGFDEKGTLVGGAGLRVVSSLIGVNSCPPSRSLGRREVGLSWCADGWHAQSAAMGVVSCEQISTPWERLEWRAEAARLSGRNGLVFARKRRCQVPCWPLERSTDLRSRGTL